MNKFAQEVIEDEIDGLRTALKTQPFKGGVRVFGDGNFVEKYFRLAMERLEISDSDCPDAFFLFADCCADDAAWTEFLGKLKSELSNPQVAQSRIVLAVLLPEIPAFPEGIRRLAERELDYHLQQFAGKNAAIDRYLELTRVYRELIRENKLVSPMMVRFDNVVAPDAEHAATLSLSKLLSTAFVAGEVTVTSDDEAHEVGLTYIRNAVAVIWRVACKGRSGAVYNSYDWRLTAAKLKNLIHETFPERIGINSRIGAAVKSSSSVIDKLKISALKCSKPMSDLAAVIRRVRAYQSEQKCEIPEAIEFYGGRIGLIQTLEIEILKEIDRICRKHDIKYFLAGGTLLGQLRYGGPIPWDDDLDIGMLREDYDKFKSVVEQELGPEFCYTCPYNDSGSHYTIDKVRIRDSYFSTKFSAANIAQDGIFVDVLVYDRTSNFKLMQKVQCFILGALTASLELKWLNRIRRHWHYRFSLIALPILRVTPYRLIHRVFDWVLTWYRNNKKAKFLIDGVGKKLMDGPLPIDGLEETRYVDFAGIKAPIPIDPVPYLTYAYGPNFIMEPPLSKRLCPHSFARIDLGAYIAGAMGQSFRAVNLNGELFEED